MTVRRVELPVKGLEPLVETAQAEGFRFLDRLVEDWPNGSLRFAGSGEGLFAVFAEGGSADKLVAVGGLTLDPWAGREDTGRLRRIYVHRNGGGRESGRGW